MQGADLAGLEAKIQQHIGSGDADSGEDFGQGMVSFKFFFVHFPHCILKHNIDFPLFVQIDGSECFHNQKPM